MLTLRPTRSGFGFGTADLPQEYDHPPLIEVWLGVEFDQPIIWNDTIEVAMHQRLGSDWSGIWKSIGPAERHSLETTRIERQLTDIMGDRAIRIGASGFCFGWLGHNGSRYPRYESIRDGFVATLDAVRELMPELGSPLRWNIAYVNRIPQGTVWNSPDDWGFIRLWQPNPLPKLGILCDGFAGRWQFPLDLERGLLAIELAHEMQVSDENPFESLWLRITASGSTELQESSLFDGLDFGREKIVRAFSELITPQAKCFWGEGPRR